MHRTLKIFIACSLGAGIGAFVALQLNQYLWWLGMIVGGVIGYLSYDFKAVINAIPMAYKAVKGWKPRKENVLAAVYGIFWALLWVLCLIPISFFSFVSLEIQGTLSLFWMICLLFSLGISANKLYDIEENDKRIFCLLKLWNPFSFTFYGFYGMTKMSVWCIKRIPDLLRFTGQFLKQLFILIHSEIRLLCGIDAAIGAGIGYFAGNAIVGVLIGGIFGVINYKVISQKILKLHVKPQS